MATAVGILGSSSGLAMDQVTVMCGCTADTRTGGAKDCSTPCEELYDGWDASRAVVGDFGHSDNYPMTLANLERYVDMQGPIVVSGMIESLALVCAVFALLSLRAQMSFKREEASDEKEIMAFGALFLGFSVPLMELCLRSGPMSYVAWIGRDAVPCAIQQLNSATPTTCISEDITWKNLMPQDFRSLTMSLRITEALFTWINTLAALLIAIGFYLLSTIGDRTKGIMNDQHIKLGMLIAALSAANFLCGMLREISWLFEIIVVLTDGLLGVILIPGWFLLLGMSMAKRDSSKLVMLSRFAVLCLADLESITITVESMNTGLMPIGEAADAKQRQQLQANAGSEPAQPPPAGTTPL